MHGSKFEDEKWPAGLRTIDLMSFAKHVGDLEFIAKHCDLQEFLTSLRDAEAQEFGDDPSSDAQRLHWRRGQSEGERLARILFPDDGAQIATAFSWVRFALRKQFRLRFVRDEAERMRVALAEQKRRVTA